MTSTLFIRSTILRDFIYILFNTSHHPCCFIGDEASTGPIELPYSSPYTFTRLAWDLDSCTSWEPFQFHLLIKTQDVNSKVDARKGTAFLKLCLKRILSSPKKFNYVCVCVCECIYICTHVYIYTCICIDVYIYR